MDYNKWLLDWYTINVAPLTSSDGFSQVITIVISATLVTSFANIVWGFYSDSLLGAIIPDVRDFYKNRIFIPADTFLDGTIRPYLANYGLDPIMNIIDQIFEFVNYVIIDIIFAFLNGDLTKDPNYA